MRDIATATLSGNLTRDVELRELRSGAEVARLPVASTARRRNGEELVDKTNYFTVEAYGAQARACSQYLSRGSRVVVDAELDWREWADQQGAKREAVTFRARQVLFEGTRPRDAAGAAAGSSTSSRCSPYAAPSTTRSSTASRASGPTRAPSRRSAQRSPNRSPTARTTLATPPPPPGRGWQRVCSAADPPTTTTIGCSLHACISLTFVYTETYVACLRR